MQHAALTNLGLVRTENQDRHAVLEPDNDHLLLILSDGMGGEAEGARAAAMVVETLSGLTPGPDAEASLARLATAAGKRILDTARENPAMEGMGATAVAALLEPDRARWVNLGDSRLYHLGRRGFRQVSRDHSFIQELRDAGDLTEEQARKHPLRHVLDQCAGTPDARPDTGDFALEPGDLVLLCSDGLHGYVPDRRIEAILRRGGALDGLARTLVDEALDTGGRDNVTVVLARV